MNRERLIRNLEAELLKIERQDRIYGVGETRYDLMIKDVLNYIENSIPKQLVKDRTEELKKEYEEALKENSTKAFILKCQIEILKELLEGKIKSH